MLNNTKLDMVYQLKNCHDSLIMNLYFELLPMKKTVEEKYPGFNHRAEHLSKFIAAGNIFTIMLKDGAIIHYTAQDEISFKQWLRKNKIEDIKCN